jgi:hypothetical protein
MWLQPSADGVTDLRMKVMVDVFGRMGAFGLSVIKTKADRTWDEFGVNAAARLGAADVAIPTPATPAGEEMAEQIHTATPATPESTLAELPDPVTRVGASPGKPAANVTAAKSIAAVVGPTGAYAKPGFWSRLFGGAVSTPTPTQSTDIRVEVRRGDTVITVQWPIQAAQECSTWLRTLNASDQTS